MPLLNELIAGLITAVVIYLFKRWRGKTNDTTQSMNVGKNSTAIQAGGNITNNLKDVKIDGGFVGGNNNTVNPVKVIVKGNNNKLILENGGRLYQREIIVDGSNCRSTYSIMPNCLFILEMDGFNNVIHINRSLKEQCVNITIKGSNNSQFWLLT